MKDDRFYFTHILECIERIERFCAGGERDFFAHDLIQDAVLRNLQVLAESSQRISPELKVAHPQIDWRALGGFRNLIVHDYLGIDIARIWRIVAIDLPDLKREILKVHSGPG